MSQYRQESLLDSLVVTIGLKQAGELIVVVHLSRRFIDRGLALSGPCSATRAHSDNGQLLGMAVLLRRKLYAITRTASQGHETLQVYCTFLYIWGKTKERKTRDKLGRMRKQTCKGSVRQEARWVGSSECKLDAEGGLKTHGALVCWQALQDNLGDNIQWMIPELRRLWTRDPCLPNRCATFPWPLDLYCRRFFVCSRVSQWLVFLTGFLVNWYAMMLKSLSIQVPPSNYMYVL